MTLSGPPAKGERVRSTHGQDGLLLSQGFSNQRSCGSGTSVNDERSSQPAPRRVREYSIGVAVEFESRIYPITVGLLAIFVVLFPVVQWMRGEAVEWGLLYALGPLLLIGYFLQAPVRRVCLFTDGTVTFQRGFGTRAMPVDAIRRIRPWLGFSRQHFVVESSKGSELLFGDPSTVYFLAQKLATLNPSLKIVGVSTPPGISDVSS